MNLLSLFSSVILTAGLLSGCAVSLPSSAPGSRFSLQPELERFEKIQGLSCSEIPEFYDTSRLKAGSTVKIKSIYDRSSKPFFETMTLRNIESSVTGKQFIVDLIAGKYIYTYEGGPAAYNRIVCSDKIDLKDYARVVEKEQKDNFLTALIKITLISFAKAQGIIFPPMNNFNEQADKDLAQILKNREIETKITGFKLISQEKLTIANQSIPCRVYRIDSITRQTFRYSKNKFNSSFLIEESFKLWVSDEVPFGFVKREGSKTLQAGFTGKKGNRILQDFSQNMTEYCEVVEFKY